MRTMMNKSPLIEMAEEYDFIVSLKGRHPAMKAHNPQYSSNARILCTAAEAIRTLSALLEDTDCTCREIGVNDCSRCVAASALEAHEDACRENNDE